MHSLLVVAKPVSWTLDRDQPRKPEVDNYNDTLSCFGKPKRVCDNVTKLTVLFRCLLCDFWLKLHRAYFSPLPLPGQGLMYKQLCDVYAGFRYKSSRWRQFRTVLWRSWLTNQRYPQLLRGRIIQTLVFYSRHQYLTFDI